ncbi:MAG: TlpA family protein disulfide reductase [Treponema sp.]|nr:TlpA family protein disulfide reductase [Treponema sp.]
MAVYTYNDGMKKIGLSFLGVLAFLALTACTNKKDIVEFAENGVQLLLSQEYLDKGISYDCYGSDSAQYPTFIIAFAYMPALDRLYEQAEVMWDTIESKEAQDLFMEDFERSLAVHQKILAFGITLPEADYKALGPDEYLATLPVAAQKYGYTYLLNTMDNSTEGMDDEEIKVYDDCRNYIEKSIKKMRVKKPVLKEQVVSGSQSLSFPQFESPSLNGNVITNEFFYDADVTMVHIWGTFCTPCIEEMPELAAWQKTLAKNVKVLGIVCDVGSLADSSEKEAAEKIISECGVGFENVIASGGILTYLTSVQFVPTTILVDSSGNIVGEPIVGARFEDYKKAVEDYVSSH